MIMRNNIKDQHANRHDVIKRIAERWNHIHQEYDFHEEFEAVQQNVYHEIIDLDIEFDKYDLEPSWYEY
jgi:hypothetical protein